MRSLLQDIRYAFRFFRRSPGFVLTAVLSLTLGIGATTVIFSVVYGILLDPYPYKDADRMVHVELRDKSGRGPLLIVNGTQHQELRKASSIDDVFLMRNMQESLTGAEFPITVQVGLYTPNLFTYMGVPPLLGREFSPADALGGNAAPVAVLSYLFWQRQYGGSREIVGKTVERTTPCIRSSVSRRSASLGATRTFICPRIPPLIPTSIGCPSSSLSPARNFQLPRRSCRR